MFLRKIIIGVLLIVCSMHSIAQTSDYSQPKTRKFAVYAGFGPSYYFNNLQIGKDYVNEFNYAIVGRFMWEPEHLLSLGIETGYYRLYSFNTPDPKAVHISNTAIPLQVVVSMKFLKSLYVSFSMGQSILINKASSDGYGDFKANSVSLADFTSTLGYRRWLNSRFSIGGEIKGFYSTGFTDKTLTVAAVGGFKF
jgi:hypothetical protein